MSIDALDIKKLVAFQLVARNGNLRQAALRLNQTIPAVSAKIKKFEEEIGVELFERLPNKLVLTERGTKFLTEVEAFLEKGAEVLATLTFTESPRGRLNAAVGSDHSWYFAPKISQFLKRFPNVELSLKVRSAGLAIQELNRGELDVCFGVFPKLPRGLEKQVITESSLALVCPFGHPLLRRPPTLAEIARQRLVVLPKHVETRKLIDRNMMHTKKNKSVIEVANCQTASIFVEKGVGVAIVHSLCIGHNHPDSVRWIDLGQLFPNIAFSVVYRKGAIRSPIVSGLIDELLR